MSRMRSLTSPDKGMNLADFHALPLRLLAIHSYDNRCQAGWDGVPTRACENARRIAVTKVKSAPLRQSNDDCFGNSVRQVIRGA